MRERGAGARAVVLSLALIALVTGVVLVLYPFGEKGLTVHVRVVDVATGGPVSGVKVKGRHDEQWKAVDVYGRVRLDDVQLAPGTRASSETLARLIELDGRFAVAAPTPPKALAKDDGAWEVELPVESFGLLTISLKATVLPNVRAYIETSDTVRAVPERGQGVARLGEPATYRVFPGPRRVPVVLKGDTGVAMARWLVRTPGPGAHLQRGYAAIPATPFAGRVVLGEGKSPPSLGGRLEIEPHDWRTLAAGNALEVLGPLDPIVVSPDGSFLAPHTSAGPFDLTLRLDFLGTFTWDAPTEIRRDAEDTMLDVDVGTTWIELTSPGDGVLPKQADWRIERDPPGEWKGWLVHHGATTYAVVDSPGRYTLELDLPGTHEQPPQRGTAVVEVGADTPATAELALAEAPHGSIEIVVPDAVRTTMRGGSLALDTGRTWSLLANLTKSVTMKNVRPGRRTVTVVWRDEAYAPFEQAIDVPEGGTATVTVERKPKAP